MDRISDSNGCLAASANQKRWVRCAWCGCCCCLVMSSGCLHAALTPAAHSFTASWSLISSSPTFTDRRCTWWRLDLYLVRSTCLLSVTSFCSDAPWRLVFVSSISLFCISQKCHSNINWKWSRLTWAEIQQNLLRSFNNKFAQVIWEEGRIAALSHMYTVESPLATMERPKFAPKSTPSRGPIPKPHYLPHPCTRPTYDAKRHPDPIRRFSQCTGQTDAPSDRQIIHGEVWSL